MKLSALHAVVLFPVFATLALFTSGCGQSGNNAGTTNAETSASDTGVTAAQAGDHSGWWCPEHGVPEDECSMCSKAAAAAFKKKGDWCEEHNRAESQCFICDPSRSEKFAARYEAKFGAKPPVPQDNTAK